MSHERIAGYLNDDAATGLLTKTDRFETPAAAAPPKDWHSEIWLPEPFEARYAYPLLVWLHDDGETELSAAPWAEATGMQNMIVLSVRGSILARGAHGFRWPADGRDVWAAIAEELAELPPELRFDASRVVLAGRGQGAAAAFAAWKHAPRDVAGACLVNPGPPADSDALNGCGSQTLGGRLWIGGLGASDWRSAGKAAFALGTDVRIEPTAVTPDRVGPAINTWVMRSIPTAVLA